MRGLSLKGEVSTFAGKAWFFCSEDGTGSAASFRRPEGITTNGANLYLYVADYSSHIIRKIVIATGAVSTLAGKAGAESPNNGTGSQARFNSPTGITISSDGKTLYVTDSGNYTIRKIEIATGKVSTLAGKLGVYGSADGVGSKAKFGSINQITTDGANLYVTDGATIRKIVIATTEVSTLAGKAGEFA